MKVLHNIKYTTVGLCDHNASTLYRRTDGQTDGHCFGNTAPRKHVWCDKSQPLAET